MDLLNIFSSLWELISFGALALPGRTCLFCLTPELDSVLAILAKSCLGAVLCQMWVWKNGTPFHWVSVYTEVSWNFIPLSFSTYFSHTFLILFSYCPYTEVFPYFLPKTPVFLQNFWHFIPPWRDATLRLSADWQKTFYRHF